MIKLIRDYRIAEDGINIVTYKAGEIVTGKVAEAALHDKAAIEHSERKPDIAKTPEPQIKKKRGKRQF